LFKNPIMRPKHAIAVSLISATTIVVFKWGTDVFNGPRPAGHSSGAGRVEFMGERQNELAVPGNAVRARPAEFVDGVMGAGPADFVDAARMVVPATVHVVANGGDFQGVVSGSGAIISNDGYIVTNNHVIDGAKTITVTLSNRQTLKAVLIGADPNTDLAVLKIDAANLPFILYGNSDEVRVGQWVLAVGYPLYLQVTATAGIVSAIGGNLGASMGQSRLSANPNNRIDSFIQTDAAVNLGNSGGPLVNTAGQIVGINTAMATPNGAYTGYSFAIPVRIVRRVVNELIAHGAVRKG
jgi:serine protease Do